MLAHEKQAGLDVLRGWGNPLTPMREERVGWELREAELVLPSANPSWRLLVLYIPSMSMMVIGHSLLY